MPEKTILCAYGVDVDAVAGWIGTYGGSDSPTDISRGMFAGEIGILRLLDLFKRLEIRATWFFPGHSIETFPEQAEAVVAEGHEVALHGYSHENPMKMSRDQEEAVLVRSIELIEGLAGVRPVGYVAPWWEFSPNTAGLLVEHGVRYDHSLMHRDHECYFVRVDDDWVPIDYSRPAEEWMHPLRRGREIDLVEVPASWYLDDLPPMMFIKASPNSHGFVTPRQLEQMWRDQFDWVYRECGYAVFPLTVHPDVSGRPHVLLMHERLVSHISAQPGARWVTFREIAEDFRSRVGALGP